MAGGACWVAGFWLVRDAGVVVPGEDLAGELMANAGPGLGRHQPVQAGLGQGGGGLVVRRPGVPNAAAVTVT